MQAIVVEQDTIVDRAALSGGEVTSTQNLLLAMLQVSEFNRFEDLAGLRSAWQAMMDQAPRASFFQTLDWLEVYWRHHGRDQRLRVLLVGDLQQPLGILPLIVRREPTRIGRVRVLTYPLDDWGTFFGPVGPHPTTTLLAGLKHVRRTQRDWDLLDLRWVNPNSDGGRTPQALRTAGFWASPQTRAHAALVELHGTWNDYWASRTSRWRNNVRRCEKQLAAAGRLQYEHFRPRGLAHSAADPRWDLYDACEAVAGQSWQARAATGTTLSHGSVRPFLRDVHATAVRVGAADLHLLRLDGRPVAFAYNYHFRGHVCGLRMGYNAGVSRIGAGTLLMYYALRTSFGLGDHTYDLGANYLDCKRYWLTTTVPVVQYTHFPWSVPRTQVLRLKRIAQRLFMMPAALRKESKRTTNE